MNKTVKNPESFSSSSEVQSKQDEIESLLQVLRDEVAKYLDQSDFKSSIIYLKKSEELLEAVMTQGKKLCYDEVLVTLQNLAFCFQKLCDFQRSLTYIDACIYNINTHPIFPQDLSDLHIKLKKAVYLSRCHIQACALLSQISSHRLALLHARRSMQSASQALKLTLKSAGHYSSIFKTQKCRSQKPGESLMHIMSILTMVNPALRSIEDLLENQKTTKGKLIPSILGVKDFPEWTFHVSLADVMLVQSTGIDEIREKSSIAVEFTKDILIMKLCVLAVSYFCTSTEMQFLKEDSKEARYLHKLAIKSLKGFLPNDSRLMVHLKETFKVRFGVKQKNGCEISLDNEKLPLIPERVTCLTPSNRRRVLRKSCGRQKTFGNLDSIVRSAYRSKSNEKKFRSLK
jgi:hypothetical protein